MSHPILTQQRLKELFDYDPLTGVFVRLVCKRGDYVGKLAGRANNKGYIVFSVDNKIYYAHRLAWLYINGVWPNDQIDHRNTIKSHNWIKNLREADNAKNQQNRHSAKQGTESGILGVYPTRTANVWAARISAGGNKIYLGCFATPALASAAYQAAKRIHHPTAFT